MRHHGGGRKAPAALPLLSNKEPPAKPVEHFRSTPGGYFHGRVAQGKTGERNLARTSRSLRDSG